MPFLTQAQFNIEKYIIHPLGSRSFIMENGTRHPLYRQQTLGTKLGLGDKAFDNGLSAYRYPTFQESLRLIDVFQ